MYELKTGGHFKFIEVALAVFVRVTGFKQAKIFLVLTIDMCEDRRGEPHRG